MSAIPQIPLKTLGRKIAFSTLVQYGGRALQILISIIALKLITNFLSDAGVSFYSTITEYALFFAVFGNLGIFSNLVRLMSDRPDDGALFGQAFSLRLLSGVAFFVLGMAFALFISSDPIFLIGCALFLAALFFDYLTAVCDAMLQANYLMGRATFALVFGRLIYLGMIFGCIRYFQSSGLPHDLFQSLSFILCANLLGAIITAAISFFLVQRKISILWKIDWEKVKKLFRASLPFGLIIVVNSLYFRFLPSYFAHENLQDLAFGSFNISFKIAQVLSLASTYLMYSALPGLKQYIDTKEWGKALQIHKKVSLLLLIAGLLVAVVGSLLGPLMIELFTHKKFALSEFWFVLPTMLIVSALSYGYDLALITLFAFNDEKWFLFRELEALIIAIVISVFSFSQLGVITSQIGSVFVILLGALASQLYIVVRGYLRMLSRLKSHQLAESPLVQSI